MDDKVVDQVAVPTLAEQKEIGNVLVWFHDTDVEEAKTYRYRLRLELVNPLLTYEEQAKNPEEAKTATISTPWSDWSAAIAMPKTREFFVTGDNPRTGEVRVEVFTRVLGEPVKEGFYIKPGDPIGQKKEKEVINPVDGMPMDQEVDFSTGAVAVDFDFNKSIVRFSFGKAQPTVEMFYLDEAGNLKSRTRASDEEAPEYRQWVKDVRAAIKAARAATR